MGTEIQQKNALKHDVAFINHLFKTGVKQNISIFLYGTVCDAGLD